ncbi:MAG: methyltransferase domain-containing protein [Actinobacteria bacterium]|nr:methyltransferase domain-containing protein [Actinomycetota bacterium]
MSIGVRELRRIHRQRNRPRRTDYAYLHLQRLRSDLSRALERVGPVEDVLDVYCGTRPYDDLLPMGARCTGLDIDDRYGAADVVSHEFLPFEDASFDLVLCIEAFHYVVDPPAGAEQLRRVLRPGGWLVLSVPLVWEYDRTILEHRYTGPELAALFSGWDDAAVVENGGRAVAWATLTGRLLNVAEERLARGPAGEAARALFAVAYLGVNGLGALLDRVDARYASPRYTLPMNLLLTARRPADG